MRSKFRLVPIQGKLVLQRQSWFFWWRCINCDGSPYDPSGLYDSKTEAMKAIKLVRSLKL